MAVNAIYFIGECGSESTPDRPIPALLLILAVLFFLSGTSALIYQVLWLRLLGLVFGVTVYAASTVWAVFMAGLALGSMFGGRAADRVKRPLVWLGVAEALIGLTALATPAMLDVLQARLCRGASRRSPVRV